MIHTPLLIDSFFQLENTFENQVGRKTNEENFQLVLKQQMITTDEENIVETGEGNIVETFVSPQEIFDLIAMILKQKDLTDEVQDELENLITNSIDRVIDEEDILRLMHELQFLADTKVYLSENEISEIVKKISNEELSTFFEKYLLKTNEEYVNSKSNLLLENHYINVHLTEEKNNFTKRIEDIIQNLLHSLKKDEINTSNNTLQTVLKQLKTLNRLFKNFQQTEGIQFFKKLNLKQEDKRNILFLLDKVQHKEKQSHFASYRNKENVSIKDLRLWLSKLNVRNINDVVPTTVQFQPQMALGEIEQFILHTDIDNQSSISEKLLSMLNRNRFFQQGQLMNFNQLTIQLKPQHLGEMIVRFEQLHGETLVKLTVSSFAAKKMLEANLNQLKQTFSPHQITIEYRNDNASPSLNTDHEELDENLKDDLHDNREESNDENQKEELDFETILKELELFEMGV